MNIDILRLMHTVLHARMFLDTNWSLNTALDYETYAWKPTEYLRQLIRSQQLKVGPSSEGLSAGR